MHSFQRWSQSMDQGECNKELSRPQRHSDDSGELHRDSCDIFMQENWEIAGLSNSEQLKVTVSGHRKPGRAKSLCCLQASATVDTLAQFWSFAHNTTDSLKICQGWRQDQRHAKQFVLSQWHSNSCYLPTKRRLCHQFSTWAAWLKHHKRRGNQGEALSTHQTFVKKARHAGLEKRSWRSC